jgi:NAD(P)-dependent dehydrogenase (short-subunit alcohol dehydrogenase family)
MTDNAFVTGADRGLGLALCAGLLERGWQVFAGQYMPEWPQLATLLAKYPQSLHILPLDVSTAETVYNAARLVAEKTSSLDLLVNNAGVISATNERLIRSAQDYTEMQRVYEVNTLGPLRVVEAFLPLMDLGRLKRLCFVSSEAGSIARSQRLGWFGYCMSKAALNMAVKNLFNELRPQGYTFRLYHPGWMRTYMNGKKAVEADMEPEEAAARALPFFLGPRDDEDRLLLVDHQGQEWPW